ncbi:zinc finger protein 646 [Stigmatopora nigra]
MAALVQHTDGHLEPEDERKFKCDECGRGYRHAGSLANHKKTHDVGCFECYVCGKENSNALALKSHLRSHKARKKYSCSQCGKAFRLATQLATHERIHRSLPLKKEDDTEYLCQIPIDSHCQSIVGTQTENNGVEVKGVVYPPQFDASQDSTDRPFKCNLCDKTYIHMRSLSNHKMTHQVGIFECDVCFKLFKNMAALYGHQRSHKARNYGGSSNSDFYANSTLEQSLDTPDNFCHLCQDLFPSPEEFKEHIQMHNSSTPFGLRDNIAGSHSITYDVTSPKSNGFTAHMSPISLTSVKSFNQPQGTINSNGHVYSNLSNNQTSPNCLEKKPQLREDSIGNVMATASEDRDVTDPDERPFRCQICDKSYRHSGSLVNHKRSHQVGNFHCTICRKTYPHLAALKSHLRTHKGHKTSPNTDGDGDCLDYNPLISLDQQNHLASQEEEADGTPLAYGENVKVYHTNQDTTQQLTPRHMCADCGVTFADISGIVTHSCPLRQQHTTEDHHPKRYFADTMSPFNGPNENYSERSFQEEDDGDIYQCSICGNNYNGMRALRCHLRGHAQSQFPVVSSVQGSLSSQEEVGQDRLEEMMICSTCGESFASRRDMTAHQLLHVKQQDDDDDAVVSEAQEEPCSIICTRCGTSCTGYRDLESHNCIVEKKEEKMEDGEEVKVEDLQGKVEDDLEDRRFRCDECGRSYRHSGSLLNHKKSHKTGVFKCSVCQKCFYNLLALKNHHRSHFDIKRYTCHKCGKAFKIHKQLLIHLRRHKENRAKIQELNNQIQTTKSEGENTTELQPASTPQASEISGESRPFACEQCGRTYRHAGSLANHRKSHRTGKEKQLFSHNICRRSNRHAGSLLNHQNTDEANLFACTFCAKHFTNDMALRSHIRIHTQRKKYACLTCGKAFRRASILHNHQKVHAPADGHSSCSVCGKSFQGRSGLKRHRCRGEDGTQPGESPDKCFTCDLCGRSYRHAGSLLNHKKSHSQNLHQCGLCLQTFPDAVTLDVHSQMRRHSCLECGKTFCLVAHLQSHMESHSKYPRSDLSWTEPLSDHPSSINDPIEKGHVCEHCGRTYRHAGSLLNHKNSHKMGSFSCSACHKEFSNLMALKNHLRIHKEPKRYQCSECGKAFRVSTQLICHRRIHSKEKPFSCMLCDKSFSCKSNLRHHQKSHQNHHTYNSPSFSLDANNFMGLDMGSFL